MEEVASLVEEMRVKERRNEKGGEGWVKTQFFHACVVLPAMQVTMVKFTSTHLFPDSA